MTFALGDFLELTQLKDFLYFYANHELRMRLIDWVGKGQCFLLGYKLLFERNLYFARFIVFL